MWLKYLSILFFGNTWGCSFKEGRKCIGYNWFMKHTVNINMLVSSRWTFILASFPKAIGTLGRKCFTQFIAVEVILLFLDNALFYWFIYTPFYQQFVAGKLILADVCQPTSKHYWTLQPKFTTTKMLIQLKFIKVFLMNTLIRHNGQTNIRIKKNNNKERKYE